MNTSVYTPDYKTHPERAPWGVSLYSSLARVMVTRWFIGRGNFGVQVKLPGTWTRVCIGRSNERRAKRVFRVEAYWGDDYVMLRLCTCWHVIV